MYHFDLELDGPYFQAICKTDPHLSQKNVPWCASYEMLKQLAAQGTMAWKGKKLIVDLFSKIPFHYEVFKTDEGLKLCSSLNDVDFIAHSHPTWFISGTKLKVLPFSIEKLPRIIDEDELAELQSEEIEVRLNFTQTEPMPVLKLADRTGAFANLFMDYGHGLKNAAAELYWEKDLLETGFIKKAVNQTQYYCPLDKVGKSLAFLLEIGWKIIDAKGNQVILESQRDLQLQEENNQIQLKGHLKFNEFTADLKNVMGAFVKRERFLDLGNGMSGLLQSDDKLATLADEIDKESMSIPKAALGVLEMDFIPWKASDQILEILKPSESQPSDLFQGTLRPYQQRGLNWLNTLYKSDLHAVLGDEMGLGKTVQVIAFLASHTNKRHLIVVPTSLLFNWEQEFKRFLPAIPCYRYHGANRELPHTGVVLTSYHTLRADQLRFHAEEWHTVILDEAQMVKNCDSQLAQAIYPLKCRFRLAMSGTLIENHARELWAHFHFLMPGMLDAREIFERELSLAEVDSRYVKKIHKMIKPFILRRRKEEVAKDLPPLQEQTVYVEMIPEQQQIYETYLASAKKKNNFEIFEVLLRLRQIVCSPLLIGEEAPSGKLETVLMDIETIIEEGKKALVFSQFAKMLHLIGKNLSARNIPYTILEGETKNREEVVKKFQEDPNCPILLITLKAGGVGLNLTAADYVLLYDPWWHDAAEAQAIARAHRIGQTKPILAKRYITQDSVEAKMLTLKKAKTALFQNLTEGELTGPELTLDDIKFLLE